MRIALDAMGGDAAPGINACGVARLLADERAAGLHVTLVGPPAATAAAMAEAGLEESDRLALRPSEGFVGMAEKPMDALRAKPNASIAVCWKMMAAGEADAVVSAGNTGAVAAAGLRTKLYLKGVKRPGVAVPLPTAQGPCVLMDAGANPGSSARHLTQYAVMGALYAKALFAGDSSGGVDRGEDWRPRVGVANIGSELGKGVPEVVEACAAIAQLDKEGRLPGVYVGNVEGRELYEGAADVVVCEGFAGNLLLKASEGLAGLLLKDLTRLVVGKLGVPEDQARMAIGKFARGYRFEEVGGAPLLGVDGVCMIAHGSSDETAIANAMLTAARIHAAGVNESIVAALA